MGLFGRSKKASAPPRWGSDASVALAWPISGLDAERDQRSWGEGMELYSSSGYWSMIKCATLLAPSLAHSFHGQAILSDGDVVNTAHHALYAAMQPNPTSWGLSDDAERCAQLVLALVRRNGWIPRDLGGAGSPIGDELFGPILLDPEVADLIGASASIPGLDPRDRFAAIRAILADEGA
ncbi:MAG: hypothetical protein U0P45_12165 [Acidimicrobiales bacterium]